MRYILAFLLACLALGGQAQDIDLQEELLRAIKENDLPAVQRLVEKGAKVTDFDEAKTPFLFWAVRWGSVDLVRYVVGKSNLKAKPKPAVMPLPDGSYYGSLLAIAVAEKRFETLRYLIEEMGLSINDKEYDANTQAETGWTALQWACKKADLPTARYLISKGANPNSYFDDADSPFFGALKSKNDTLITAIIDAGLELNKPNKEGVLPVFYIIYHASLPILEKAIQKGADIQTAVLDKLPPFHYALWFGRIDQALFLLEKGAKYENTPELAPLQTCAKNGYLPVLKALLKRKVNPNNTDINKRTALMFAAYNNQLAICKMLLDAKADQTIQDAEGKTALDYAKAKQMTQAVALLENPKSYQKPSEWERLNSETVMYVNANQMDRAIETSRHTLAHVGKTSGTQSLDYAKALKNIGLLLANHQRVLEALPYLQNAQTIYEKHQIPPQDKGYQAVRSILEKVYFELGRYTESLELSLEMPDGLGKCYRLSKTYYKTSQFDKAQEFITKAETFSTEFKEVRGFWDLKAQIHMDKGELKKADSVYKHVFPLLSAEYKANEQREAHDYATFLHNYSDLMVEMGKYDIAEKYALEAKDLIEKRQEEKQIAVYADVLSGLGVLYLETGRHEEAKKILREAGGYRSFFSGTNTPSYASILSNLGDAYYELQQFRESEYYYREALGILERAIGKEDIKYATTLNNLANLFAFNGKHQLAEKNLRASLQITERLGLTQSLLYARMLGNLSTILFAQKKWIESETYSQKALEGYRQTVGENHVDYFSELCNYAGILQGMGKTQEALAYWDKSIVGIRNFAEKLYPNMSEKQQTAYGQRVRMNLNNYKTFLLESMAKEPALASNLLNSTLALKGIYLNTKNKIRREILATNDRAGVMQYRKWLKLKEDMGKYYQYTASELRAMKVDLEVMEQEVERAEAKMSQAIAQKIKPQNYTWQDIQKTLKPQEVAIEALQFEASADSVSYAFLLFDAKSAYPEVVVLPNGNQLEGKFFKNYINSIKSQKQDKYSYQAYWQPLLKAKTLQGGKKTIFFSPDGIYHQISLNSLQNLQTKNYVIDEQNVLVVSSLKDRFIDYEKAKNSGEAVLVGFPKYYLPELDHRQAVDAFLGRGTAISSEEDSPASSTVSVTRELSRSDIQELPGTKVEVENITTIAKQKGRKVRNFLGSQALEEVVKSMRSPSILHIATHGFFLQNLESMRKGGKVFGLSASKLYENPLLRAGLLLTGSGRNIQSNKPHLDMENGILTAEEAMHLQLNNTDLVVLSACETGVGEVSAGEGVYGLQRAFRLAGAKAVLMSMWTVSDDATQLLMTVFYEQWLNGKTASEAFQTAQKEVRKKYPEPYYWAAFVMIGGEQI